MPYQPSGLDTPEIMRGRAAQIRLQATLTQAMPPGNVIELSAETRRIPVAWIAAGAALD